MTFTIHQNVVIEFLHDRAILFCKKYIFYILFSSVRNNIEKLELKNYLQVKYKLLLSRLQYSYIKIGFTFFVKAFVTVYFF